MSLRARIIALFCGLVLGPLATLGVSDYLGAMRTLRRLVAAQTGDIAQRAASDLQDRYRLRESDLLLLAENAETQRLLRARRKGRGPEIEAAWAAADHYLRRAWEQFARSYLHVELLDWSGASAYRLGVPDEESGGRVTGGASASDVLVVRKPITDVQDGSALGSLIASIRVAALLPPEALDARFGRAGFTTVLDRSSGRVVFHPQHAFSRITVAELTGPENWNIVSALLAREQGSFVHRHADTTRVASFVSLESPPWTIVSSGAVDEFAAPIARGRLVNLLLVVVIAIAASAAFILLTRRSTRSLEALTAAADQVGTGNFEPALPSYGKDEIGRLSAAFGLMVEKVRAMVREIELSRHMAAVGAFAAQLSHEVRNPLTSLKLNLQSLERDAEAGQLPESASRPVTICLREIERLDRVVGGALSLAREREPVQAGCSVHAIVGNALDVVRAQLADQGVVIDTSLLASPDHVKGDPEGLEAAFLNLFLNAADAMPRGGRLSVSTERVSAVPGPGRVIRVRVADTGPGVPVEAREQIFEPFYSTRPRGTGFGLPVALRTVEEHGGRLRLVDDGRPPGATFLVELPLCPEETGT